MKNENMNMRLQFVDIEVVNSWLMNRLYNNNHIPLRGYTFNV